MKKTILLFAAVIIAASSFSQAKKPAKADKPSKWSFKVGLVSPLPLDIQLQSRIQLRSMMAEAACKVSPKVDMTFHAGYLMFSYRVAEHFENMVAMPGFRYNVKNGSIYFGTSTGVGFFSEHINDGFLLWSPYVGIKGNKISADLRYFNWRALDNSINTVGVVVSYNL